MARAMLRSSLKVMMVAVIFMAAQRPPAAAGAKMKQSRKIASASQPSLRRPAIQLAAIVQHGMAASENQQHQRPRSAIPNQKLAQRQQQQAERQRYRTVTAREKRVDDVAAIQLSDRQQVQGRGQHADPGCARRRMQIDVADGDAGKNQFAEQPLKPGTPNCRLP